jgi:ribose 5-phosphate isomerase B
VRAVVYYGGKLPDIVKLTKEHNHANVLSLAATFVSEDEAKDMIRIWLTTPFTFEERHVRRLKEIQQIEDTGRVQHN